MLHLTLADTLLDTLFLECIPLLRPYKLPPTDACNVHDLRSLGMKKSLVDLQSGKHGLCVNLCLAAHSTRVHA